ncbi:MAG: hypothetical protein ACREPM_08585 [Gemmatimonadaceae bacterium]
MSRMHRIVVLSTPLVFLFFAGTAAQAQGRGRGRGTAAPPPPPVPTAEQQRRIQDEQRRTTEYRQHLDDQARAEHQREASLQTAKRVQQLRAQQDYAAALARRQAELRTQRDYAHEEYITAPQIYRYRVNNAYRETNQYGADLLRDAVRNGYSQGYRAGAADRADHWRYDYANSPAYQEATFGYGGSYVDRSDFSYYFRQGFQKGYSDGYYSRSRYGTFSNGAGSILANVLGGILQLTTIH